MSLIIDWIRKPFVRLQLLSGIETIAQSVGIVQDFKFDTDLEQPALLRCISTVTGNVNVVYWNGSTEIIDVNELSSKNILIKRINSASTTVDLADIRLEL